MESSEPGWRKDTSVQPGPSCGETHCPASGQVCTLSQVVVILFPEHSTTHSPSTDLQRSPALLTPWDKRLCAFRRLLLPQEMLLLQELKEIYLLTPLRKCLWSQLLRRHVTGISSDPFRIVCNYQLTSTTVEVNIYAANTSSTKCELFQDTISRTRSFPNYFRMPSSRWTTDLHPKWKLAHQECRRQGGEEKLITEYKKSQTSSTTHWIKATPLCIKIFRASSHIVIFHPFQQFT